MAFFHNLVGNGAGSGSPYMSENDKRLGLAGYRIGGVAIATDDAQPHKLLKPTPTKTIMQPPPVIQILPIPPSRKPSSAIAVIMDQNVANNNKGIMDMSVGGIPLFDVAFAGVVAVIAKEKFEVNFFIAFGGAYLAMRSMMLATGRITSDHFLMN
jgi:hypothetical protein